MTALTIGLCGPAGRSARCGKSTVAEMLRDQHGFEILSFADPVRDMALAIDPLIPTGPSYGPSPVEPRPGAQHCVSRLSLIVSLFGWEHAKDAYPEVRRILQRVGTEGARRTLGETVWVAAWYRRQGVAADAWRNVVAPDVRFPNEAEQVRQAGGVVVMVDRPGHTDQHAAGHASEAGIPNSLIDWALVNDGDLDDLRRKVDHLVRDLQEPIE